jgi:hypothetical protein
MFVKQLRLFPARNLKNSSAKLLGEAAEHFVEVLALRPAAVASE